MGKSRRQWQIEWEDVMGARRALIGLIIAFGVAASIAALTTIRQVHIQTSSLSHPVTRI